MAKKKVEKQEEKKDKYFGAFIVSLVMVLLLSAVTVDYATRYNELKEDFSELNTNHLEQSNLVHNCVQNFGVINTDRIFNIYCTLDQKDFHKSKYLILYLKEKEQQKYAEQKFKELHEKVYPKGNK